MRHMFNLSTLLTSWTPPITDPAEILEVINEGGEYIRTVDSVVRMYYSPHAKDT